MPTTPDITVRSFNTPEAYIARLNRALRDGEGIAFHNNSGLIVRNPAGIGLINWDIVVNFNQWKKCPACRSKKIVATYAG